VALWEFCREQAEVFVADPNTLGRDKLIALGEKITLVGISFHRGTQRKQIEHRSS